MYNGNSISIYDVLRRTFMLSQTAAVHLAVVYVHPVYTLEINTRLKYLLLDWFWENQKYISFSQLNSNVLSKNIESNSKLNNFLLQLQFFF